MKSPGVLSLGVADLLRRPGSRREEHLEVRLGELAVLGSQVPDVAVVELDVRLESVNEGIVVAGTVRAPWQGPCRRCLKPVQGTVESKVLEVFEDEPVEGETRPLEVDRIDLEPMTRDAILLELPLAPLCNESCAGLCPDCGVDRNTVDCGHELVEHDPRWAALDELRFDE